MFTYKPMTEWSIRKTKYLYHLTTRESIEAIKESGVLKGYHPTWTAHLMMLLGAVDKRGAHQIYFFRTLKRTSGAFKQAEVCIRIPANNRVIRNLLATALHRKVDDAVVVEAAAIDLRAVQCKVMESKD